jgi:hypothetical protein
VYDVRIANIINFCNVCHIQNGPTVKTRHDLVSPTERDEDLQNSGITKDTFVTTNLNFGSVILQITDAVVMSSADTTS